LGKDPVYGGKKKKRGVAKGRSLPLAKKKDQQKTKGSTVQGIRKERSRQVARISQVNLSVTKTRKKNSRGANSRKQKGRPAKKRKKRLQPDSWKKRRGK